MADFTQIQFNPETGLNNFDVYPTTPLSETEARGGIQSLFDQIKDYINEILLSELENAIAGTSGADKLGSGEIRGISGYTVREQITSLAETMLGVTDGLAVPGDDTVSTDKIQDYAVTGIKIENNTIDSSKLMVNSVGTLQIANGAITAAKIAGGTFDGSVITDNTISEEKLCNDSVSQMKIRAGAVSNSKLASDAVDTVNIANAAVTTDKIANGAVSSSKLGTIANIRVSTSGDTISYNDATDTWTLNVVGCAPVQLCPIIFSSFPDPPSGLYPTGTLYIQYQG